MKIKPRGARANFYSAAEEVVHAKRGEDALCDNPQVCSPAYRLAFADDEFLLSEEMRPLRLMLELDKPERMLQALDIEQTVAIFGSARTVDLHTAEAHLAQCESSGASASELAAAKRQVQHGHYYEQARELAKLIAEESPASDTGELHVVTGGGPGVMEAANRGAIEAGAKTTGLNIVLPHEQVPNPYISPELCFRFHYFAIRKMHFLMRAKAIAVFPGGFGTLDELFEVLTLVQTGKVQPLPILIFGKPFWEKLINFEHLMEEGVISAEDLKLFSFVDTAEEAWKVIQAEVSTSS